MLNVNVAYHNDPQFQPKLKPSRQGRKIWPRPKCYAIKVTILEWMI